MTQDRPPPEVPPPSLVARLGEVRPALGPGRRGVAIAVAVILAAAPWPTIAAARWLAARAQAEAERLTTSDAARATAEAEAGRDTLRTLAARGGIAGAIGPLARALPADARLLAVGRDGPGGATTAEVETPDPDRLRAALRRLPATAAYRDTGQRAAPGGMVVTIVEATR